MFGKFKSRHIRNHPVRSFELVNPPREWFLGILIATGTFVIGALYLGYDFWDQYHMVDNRPIISESVTRYRENDATFFLNAFKKQDAQFQALRTEKRHAVTASNTPEVSDVGVLPVSTLSAPVIDESLADSLRQQ